MNVIKHAQESDIGEINQTKRKTAEVRKQSEG